MIITFFLFNCVLGRWRPTGRESGACPPGGEFIVLMSDVSILMCSKYHTHTHLTALCPGLPGWTGTRKVKQIWILLKQETVSGSGISRAICKSAPRCRQITTPAPHHSVFLQAGCPSCCPTNSVKARVCIAITWCECGILLCSNTCHTFCGPYVSVYWDLGHRWCVFNCWADHVTIWRGLSRGFKEPCVRWNAHFQ